MDPTGLVPTPDPIPAPWWLFEGLGQLTFLVHILLVDIVLGGVLLLLAGRLLRRPPGGALAVLDRPLPTTMALTINLGVAPLLFLQVIWGHLFYTSAVLMAVPWLLVIPLLIVGYYALYVNAAQAPAGGRLATAALAVAAPVFLFISFVYVNNLTLMQRPAVWDRWFAAPGGGLLNLDDPTFWPRWLHVLPAAVAMAGLAVALLWGWRERRAGAAADDVRAAAARGKAVGLRIFAWATAVQIASGLWWVFALPRDVMRAFMGQDLFATIVFALGFLTGLGVLVTAFLGKLRATVVQLALQMALMVALRAIVRHTTLADAARPAALPVVPQYDVLALFLAVLAVGVAAVFWMLRAAARPAGAAAATGAGAEAPETGPAGAPAAGGTP